MNQRIICLYLSRNGFSAHAIHEEFVQILGPDAIAYSTVTYHLRASRWTAQTEERHSDPPPDVVDNIIFEVLDQTPFASVRELAKATCIPRMIVWIRLTESLGFVVKHLHWVPHSLTDAQWQNRIDRSKELLRLLEFAQANDWESLMTLDESWFYLCTSHEIVWLQAGQQPPDMVKHMIGDRKMMVTIVWNPHGFYLVDGLPKGQKFNASYYIDNILQPILESRSTRPGSGLIIHADNARPHTAQKISNFAGKIASKSRHIHHTRRT